MKTHKTKLKKEQNRTHTIQDEKKSIQFTKPMQIELSQLLRMMFNVKVHSNALEKVQSNQSLNCLKSQIRVDNHPNNL